MIDAMNAVTVDIMLGTVVDMAVAVAGKFYTFPLPNNWENLLFFFILLMSIHLSNQCPSMLLLRRRFFYLNRPKPKIVLLIQIVSQLNAVY